MDDEQYRAPPGDHRYHQQRAARLRALASTVTTGPVKAHLLREIEQHERFARGEPALSADETATRPRSRLGLR
jgi:hypothetical protein